MRFRGAVSAFAVAFTCCCLINVGSYFLWTDGHGIQTVYDGISRIGLPYVFYEEGGFAYRKKFYAKAIAIDLAMAVGISTLATCLWASNVTRERT